jgi:tetratricopeptide (TPR) repeat protein
MKNPIPILLTLFLLAVGHAFGGTLSPAETEELFEEGKSLFRQANSLADENPDASRKLMQKALLRFQRLVKEGGIRNGRLYYDLGNIQFQLDDLGRAILNYRRALDYIPDDPNLQQNLAFARSQRADAFGEPEQQKILKTLFFWHYDFTLRTRSVLFIATFLTFWVLLALRLFVRSAWLVRLAMLFGVLALLLLGSVIQTQIRQRRSNPGVIVAREIVARLSDSENAAPAFTDPLHAGTEFELVEDRGDWCQVRLPDGQTCWLPRDAIGLVH